jgi:hypothetical protein
MRIVRDTCAFGHCVVVQQSFHGDHWLFVSDQGHTESRSEANWAATSFKVVVQQDGTSLDMQTPQGLFFASGGSVKSRRPEAVSLPAWPHLADDFEQQMHEHWDQRVRCRLRARAAHDDVDSRLSAMGGVERRV